MIEFFREIGTQLLVLVFLYFLVLILVFMDLAAGIRKAKERGEYRTSYGLRKTVDKICRYYNMLFVITIIDVVQMLALWHLNAQTDHALPILPFFTFIGTIFIGVIELKSIYEKNDVKEQARIKDAATLVSRLMQNDDTRGLVEDLINYMKRDRKEGETDNGQL